VKNDCILKIDNNKNLITKKPCPQTPEGFKKHGLSFYAGRSIISISNPRNFVLGMAIRKARILAIDPSLLEREINLYYNLFIDTLQAS